MPEKDGSDDKKSTKSVVNKKQKQFMNKEQLDLTSVAESFGGEIIGEPVELDEAAFAIPAAYYGYTALAGLGAAYWANRKKINQGLANTFANMFGGTTTADDIIWRDDKSDVINPGALDTKKDGDVKVNKDLAGTNVGTNVIAKDKVIAKDIAKAETATKTKRLPKPFKMRLPKIPGTPHNVGRRVNPQ
jgi:hypothetical protein